MKLCNKITAVLSGFHTGFSAGGGGGGGGGGRYKVGGMTWQHAPQEFDIEEIIIQKNV